MSDYLFRSVINKRRSTPTTLDRHCLHFQLDRNCLYVQLSTRISVLGLIKSLIRAKVQIIKYYKATLKRPADFLQSRRIG